jgi:uncharacterized protein YuzB (UPF0349 family)
MISDTVSVHVRADAAVVFAYISDRAKMDRWSFGTWHNILHNDGILEGRSMATGAAVFLRIDADPARMIVDYHLGTTPDALSPRIFARVMSGDVIGETPDSAVLLLTGLRSTDMDDERWNRLRRGHAAELDIIKGQIESGHNPRGE